MDLEKCLMCDDLTARQRVILVPVSLSDAACGTKSKPTHAYKRGQSLPDVEGYSQLIMCNKCVSEWGDQLNCLICHAEPHVPTTSGCVPYMFHEGTPERYCNACIKHYCAKCKRIGTHNDPPSLWFEQSDGVEHCKGCERRVRPPAPPKRETQRKNPVPKRTLRTGNPDSDSDDDDDVVHVVPSAAVAAIGRIIADEPVDEEVVVYTDGACSANGTKEAKAGSGVWFGAGDPRNISKRLPGNPQTNQRAELYAVLLALRAIPKGNRVSVHTDSNYVIGCCTQWLKNWKRNGWRAASNKPVQNADLVKAIDAELVSRETVRFIWVKGHSGDQGNDGADALATAAIV